MHVGHWSIMNVSAVEPDLDTGGKTWPTKIYIEAEGFSFSLDFLHGGLGKSKLQFLSKKYKFFSGVFFPEFFLKPWIRLRIHLKCWIRIRIHCWECRFNGELRDMSGNYGYPSKKLHVFCQYFSLVFCSVFLKWITAHYSSRPIPSRKDNVQER